MSGLQHWKWRYRETDISASSPSNLPFSFSWMEVIPSLFTLRVTVLWGYSNRPIAIFELWYPEPNAYWNITTKKKKQTLNLGIGTWYLKHNCYFIFLLLFLNKWVSRDTVTLLRMSPLTRLMKLKSFMRAATKPGFPPCNFSSLSIYRTSILSLLNTTLYN